MSTMTEALVASLSVQQTGPLGERRAANLLRRCSFHISKSRVDQLATMTADQAVDLLFDTAEPAPYMVKPLFNDDLNQPIQDWIDDNNQTGDETRKRRAVCGWWLRNAIHDDTAHHKTAFWLHTTFTTGHEGLTISGSVNGQNQSLTRDVSRYLYDHVRLLNWLTHSTPNAVSLKKVARKITMDNLMLGYLNNRQNFNTGVNENYAREFLELFTIGRGAQTGPGQYENYDETDVTKAAEVFSGFSTKVRRNSSDIDLETGIYMGTPYPNLHVAGDKQFSVKFTGPNNPVMGEQNPTVNGMWNELDQFIDMVFDQFATAENYAEKLYRFFFAIELDTMFVDDVANDLFNNGYDYISTLKKMLKSQHFYAICDADPNLNGGNLIKSPLEMVSEAYSFFQGDLPPIVDPNNPTVPEIFQHSFRFPTVFLFNYYGQNVGLLTFSPANVAGYPAYYQEPGWDKNWYSPGTIPTRFGLGNRLVNLNNLGLNVDANLDSVAYANYLDGLGVDVSNADEVVDHTLCIFPQVPSNDRRQLILDIFLDHLSPVNWMFIWNCYKGTPPFPPTGCDPQFPTGNPGAIRPHLDALLEAVLAAHEFQLK